MPSPSPLRFLSLLAVTSLVAALGIFLFNAVGPAAGAKRQVKEWYVSRMLLSGKHLVPPDNLDECEQRWSMAMQAPVRPDIAVMGSSHGLLASRKNLPAQGLINFSISGACLAEHWVTTQLLHKRGLAPKVMLVFVDPWLFDIKTDWSLWHARSEELQEFEARLCASDPKAIPVFGPRYSAKEHGGMKRLFSLDPLISYVNDLYGHLPFNLRIIEEPDKVVFTVLRSDGGKQLNTDRGSESGPVSRAKALREFATTIDPHRYGTFARIDENLWRLFVAWLKACKAQGSELWLVFPPYHPAIYKSITASPNNQLARIDARARKLAGELGAKCFGSYDPKALGFDDLCFLDGDHLSEHGMRRLLAPAATEWANRQAGP